jgi:hypothetical protein
MAKLFPSIKSLDVLVEIDGHDVRGLSQRHRYNESNLPDLIDCPDRNCRGGFQISTKVRAMVDQNEEHKKDSAVCSGQRGASPLGVCVTQFTYSIDIVYR